MTQEVVMAEGKLRKNLGMTDLGVVECWSAGIG